MIGKKVQRLNRRELLELILKLKKENEELHRQLSECEKKLQDREICKEKAGTLAEAALAINRVFEAADEAAKQYLENIRRYDGETGQFRDRYR